MLRVSFLFRLILKKVSLGGSIDDHRGPKRVALITRLSSLNDCCESLSNRLNFTHGELSSTTRSFSFQLGQDTWFHYFQTRFLIFIVKLTACQCFINQKLFETSFWALGTFRAVP